MSMLFVPRSTILVSDPVRRSRWKRSDKSWTWRNTWAASRRAASCPTFSKMALRKLSKSTPPRTAHPKAKGPGRPAPLAGDPAPPRGPGGGFRRAPPLGPPVGRDPPQRDKAAVGFLLFSLLRRHVLQVGARPIRRKPGHRN